MEPSPPAVNQISHELRTHLTPIRAAMDLLSQGKLDPKSSGGQRLLAIAASSIERLLQLSMLLEGNSDLSQDVSSSDVNDRLQLESDLRIAVRDEKLQVYYQPIFELGSDPLQLYGFEALARWPHPQRGWVPPSEFIPLAESTGLIHLIGRWVLWTACQQLQSWQHRCPAAPPLTMSVNLSPKQVDQADLAFLVEVVLTQTGLAPEQLKLEITESSTLKNYTAARATLLRLRELGTQICVDDFGTGYASLTYLHDLPLNMLKIDRSFVMENHWETVQAILMLASRLHLKVVAEGIETAEQLTQLKEYGCDYGQGYHLGRPLDAEASQQLILKTLQVQPPQRRTA